MVFSISRFRLVSAIPHRVFDALRRGDFLSRHRLLAYIRVLAVAQALMVAYFLLQAQGLMGAPSGSMKTEFVSFYAAGRLADQADAAGIYDMATHALMERHIVHAESDVYFAFFYPPVFILLCAPLALLPFIPAYLLWAIGIALLFLAGMRRILPGRPLFLALLAYPAMLESSVIGENAMLTAALLAFATSFLERRPWLAGLVFGGLCYKPHFMIPGIVALVAGRRWRALAGMASSVAALCLLSGLMFGWRSWIGFLHLAPTVTPQFALGIVSFTLLDSPLAFVRLLGGPIWLATIVQVGCAGTVLWALAWLWARVGTRPELRMAAITAAIPLVLWVILYYDLAVTAIAMAWLIRLNDAEGYPPWEKIMLAVMFVLPFAALIGGIWHFPVAVPVTATFFTMIAVRGGRDRLYRTRNLIKDALNIGADEC